MNNFPVGTAVSFEIEKLIQQDAILSPEERMSTRMVKSAPWQARKMWGLQRGWMKIK